MINTKTHYNEIINWLEAYCKKTQRRIKTYRGLEYSTEFVRDVSDAKEVGTRFIIDPRLPIDLVAVKSTRRKDVVKKTYRSISLYTLFWFVTSYSKTIETKVKFYQLYLSRVSTLDAVRVIMVIPFTSGQTLKRKLRKIADDNGIGLWRVKPGENPKEICVPKDFREHMEDTFRNPPKAPEKSKRMKRFPQKIRDQAPDITFFYEGFVREAVEAMAGVTPQTIGKRYIERKILDLVFQLQNSRYLKNLRELVTKHLSLKGNDFDFVKKVFSDLWLSEFKMQYSDFLKVAEAPLYNIYATRGRKPYRDHYLHQFQVFLLGLYIIDNFRNKFDVNIDKKWLITASFHDMAYPIELYDFWAKNFFFKSLGVREMGTLDIRSFFVEKSLLVRLGFLINDLYKKHFSDSGGELKGNWLNEEKDLVLFFYKKITEVKHHCILSSLYLLKEAQSCQSCPEALFNSLFVPSAAAIAIHHPTVIFKDDKAFQELRPERQLKSLDFNNDPMAFLLIFCDCAQEWGRPSGKKPNPRNVEEEQNFVFQNCYINKAKTKCSITLRTPYLYENDQKFEYKANELRALGEFLKSPPGLEFKIILEDRSKKQTPFIMRGPS